ncbi:hypothetical protein GS506_22555 [Rhodococcus hoagii]|nr:hypothetical protein [Prescottella equi]
MRAARRAHAPATTTSERCCFIPAPRPSRTPSRSPGPRPAATPFVAFDHAYHGPHHLTMALTGEEPAVQGRVRPVRPRGGGTGCRCRTVPRATESGR